MMNVSDIPAWLAAIGGLNPRGTRRTDTLRRLGLHEKTIDWGLRFFCECPQQIVLLPDALFTLLAMHGNALRHSPRNRTGNGAQQ